MSITFLQKYLVRLLTALLKLNLKIKGGNLILASFPLQKALIPVQQNAVTAPALLQVKGLKQCKANEDLVLPLNLMFIVPAPLQMEHFRNYSLGVGAATAHSPSS